MSCPRSYWSSWDTVEDTDLRCSVRGFRARVELLMRASRLADLSGNAGRGLELAEQARAAIDERAEPRRAAAAEMRIGRSMHFAGRGVLMRLKTSPQSGA